MARVAATVPGRGATTWAGAEPLLAFALRSTLGPSKVVPGGRATVLIGVLARSLAASAQERTKKKRELVSVGEAEADVWKSENGRTVAHPRSRHPPIWARRCSTGSFIR